MTYLASTNTSINMKYPVALLVIASASLCMNPCTNEDLSFTQLSSEEHLSYDSNYNKYFYPDNNDTSSSGLDFRIDNYIQKTNEIKSEEILLNFLNKIVTESVSMEPEMIEVINQNFWDLF